MTYTLVLLVCLVGPPRQCEVHEEPIRIGVVERGIVSIEALALKERWEDENPGYKVRGWRLRRGFRA